MSQIVTIIISLLAGAIVITMTCPAPVAIVTVCGVAFVSALLARAVTK